MRTVLLLFAVMILPGCGRIVDQAKKAVGLKESEAEKKARLEAEKKEAEEKVARLKKADQQVEEWAERLATEKAVSGGFAHHEGITDADPWGQLIRVEYDQDGTDEVMTVTSAGPDKTFDTKDDLKRQRKERNLAGVHRTWTFIIIAVWVSCGVSLLLAQAEHRKATQRQRRGHSPVLSGIITILIAPLLIVAYIFVALGKALSSPFGGAAFDGGFEALDIDLDFDFF